MSDSYNPFEENEISIHSQGGTERMKRGLAQRLPEGLADDFQVICSRIRKYEEDKIRIYWVHDLPEDPELAHIATEESRSKFHQFVFCGQWQYYRFQHHLKFPYNIKSIVIDTAIEPFDLTEPKPDDKIRMIYTSTPQRGLQLLVPVFEALAKEHSNIHLDVFSSFKIYGGDFEKMDKQFEPLYDQIRNHPQMTYHGFAPNDVVKDHLKKAHIFAYPSIWVECNSQSLIEAMSAKCICVHPNWGGLIDTGGGLTHMYQGDADPNVHANVFYAQLQAAIAAVGNRGVDNYLSFVKSYADNRYNWNRISGQWAALMERLKLQYPDTESRAMPKEMFVYRTS